jgi:hypothetical protein
MSLARVVLFRNLTGCQGVGATQLNFDGTEDTGVGFSGGGFCLSTYFNRSNDCPYQVWVMRPWYTMLPRDGC